MFSTWRSSWMLLEIRVKVSVGALSNLLRLCAGSD